MSPIPSWPIPNRLSLTVDDLTDPGAELFFNNVEPTRLLKDAVIATFTWLYDLNTAPNHVRSIALVLRSMEGVAHTCGDHNHKEIHFSLEYIRGIPRDRAAQEISGVIAHEVVHCFQYDGESKCPKGLIEGIADYVRLRAGLAPPHWNPSKGERWDAGYATTAYFLDWLEHRKAGTVRELNSLMKDREYDDDIFQLAAGDDVENLWRSYCAERSQLSYIYPTCSPSA